MRVDVVRGRFWPRAESWRVSGSGVFRAVVVGRFLGFPRDRGQLRNLGEPTNYVKSGRARARASAGALPSILLGRSVASADVEAPSEARNTYPDSSRLAICGSPLG